MGRHSAPRASFVAALGATVQRRGAHAARRTTFGTGAAVAVVALTTTAATAALVDVPADGPSHGERGAAEPEPTPAPTAAAPAEPAGPAAPGAVGTALAADPQSLEAASDELVRAEFLTTEGATNLSADVVAKIDAARARLNEAVVAAEAATATVDPLGDGSTAADPLEAPGTAATDGQTPSDDAAATTDDGETADAESAGGVAEEAPDALTERTPDRASRAGARDGLTAATGGEELTEPVAPTTEDASGLATPDEPAPADAPPQDAPGEGTTADATVEPAAPTTEEVQALTAELRTLLDASQPGLAVEVVPGPPTAEETAAQLDEWAATTSGYSNGNIPANVLCELSFAPGHRLRCDAAHQAEELNALFREAFGRDLTVNDSYRSYGAQVAVKRTRGYFAATPGTSNHGWALALDLGGGVNSYGTAEYRWMRENAPAFGWDNPEWARAGGSKNEPWHWEYGSAS